MSQTGVNRTAGLGGWRGTIRGADPAQVLAILSDALGEARERGWGTRWYARAYDVGLNGSVVGSDPRHEQGEVFVDVRQADCDALGYRASVALLETLVGLGLKLTRLDLYVDDWERVVRPAEMVAAFDAGQTVTRVRRRRHVDDGRDEQAAWFGSRASEWYYRVYDKAGTLDSGAGADRAGSPLVGRATARPAARVRHELEAKDRTAVELGHALLAGQAPADALWAYVTGVLDFRDRRAGQAHGERAERLSWWRTLIDGAERTRVAARVRIDHLAKRAAWLHAQAARSLATVRAVYGNAWVTQLLDAGADRLTARDYAVIRAAAP